LIIIIIIIITGCVTRMRLRRLTMHMSVEDLQAIVLSCDVAVVLEILCLLALLTLNSTCQVAGSTPMSQTGVQ
jgi:hypothetical protein